ncbi:BRO family protein [Bacillus sp. FSL W8-0519]|uniref:BRO family protein n=1 Tax=Bacillus TaxID=1386 RepID=UPI000C32D051|nr:MULTISPECIES: BRO family protein [Bacillus cereus group]MCC2411240.1 phage antirepressor KilAC domain-containing protein [Bacillus paranthracis]MDA1588989.1 BRO family protein [Bacillus cereus group sp. TH225LC]PKF96671.1 phage repressor protein/antirepressor Ant [Bacillus cereus]
MSNSLQVFDNGLGELRAIKEGNQVWFIAKDVCDVLEIGNPSQALVKLDEEEKNTIIINEGIGNPNKLVVNESGLYNLIFLSRKPQAKAFKKWITSEVLPSIRQDGGYMITTEDDDEQAIIARALVLAQKTLDRKSKQLAQAKKTIEEQTPAVEYHNKVLSIEGFLPVTDIAKQLGFRSAQELTNELIEKKVLFRSKRGSYLHTSHYAYLKEKGCIQYKNTGYGGLQLLISEKGKKEFARLIGITQ